MNARVATLAACTVVVVGVWVAVLLQKPQTQADRLPSSGPFPAITTPAPSVAPPAPGPIQGGPAGAAPGHAVAPSGGVDQEDVNENDVEDEPRPAYGSGLSGVTTGLAIIARSLGLPPQPSRPPLAVP